MASDNVGQLEADALKRKERLNALKRRREDNANDSSKTEENKDNEVLLPKPKFRSYRPQDEEMHDLVVPDAKPGDVETAVAKQLEAAASKVVIEELDLTTLAPRKPDWDLKRDVTQKLEKLERRTQRAIAELIRDRLREGTNLADAVALEGNLTKSKLRQDDE